MNICSKLFIFVSVIAVLLGSASGLASAATFNSNLIMDDTVFDSVGSMSAAQIDAFLNTFPNSCISPNSGFSAIDPTGYNPNDGYQYGGYVSAGQVIYDAAQAYGLNPQVLIATLQKEQSLVIGGVNYCNDGDQHKYAAAVGYGCPDSGTRYSYTGLSLYRRNGTVVSSTGTTCVTSPTKAGFSQQVIRAAWLFKFGEQRSKGNVGWAVIKGNWNNSDDPQTCYGGPMTQGTFQRCPSGASTYYDGYFTIDSNAVHIDSGATAAFYWYTPHFHGNQNFYDLFTSWFGGTVSSTYYSCHDATNVSGAASGEKILRRNLRTRADNLTLVVPNNTSTACVEAHTWLDRNYQNWLQHTATNSPAINPSYSEIITADIDGTGSRMYQVNYSGTGSGMIELHGWDSANLRWVSHIASNRAAIPMTDARVVAADPNGDGRDEFYLVQYRNTQSGRVEVHGWTPNLQQWSSHIATNLPGIDPAQGKVLASSTGGDGRDQFVYVKFAGAQSSSVEFHVWTPNLQQWTAHIASNLSMVGYDPALNDVIAADTNGDGRDDYMFVKYGGTASGRVEIHGWTPNLQQWSSHIATSSGSFQ